MKIVHFHRKRHPERFSIEGYFERVRAYLSDCMDIRLQVLPCFSNGFFPRLWNALWVVGRQADVNHVTGDVHYITLFLRKRRTLLTIHDCEILNRLSGWKRWLVLLLWYRLPARRVSAITVNSEETKRQVLQLLSFPEDRVYVIPVSVPEIYQPTAKPFNFEQPRILQVGTKANKNLPRLADALRGMPCKLHIVGPISEELERRLQANGIDYCSHQFPSDAELFQLYCDSDIVSFVSTYEGFGMPIIEAQRVGRVCVTSNCSSMPEVAGEGACFVNPFDVSSIRAGFHRVVSSADYRDQLVKLGKLNAERFSAASIAESFDAVYRSIHQRCCGPYEAGRIRS